MMEQWGTEVSGYRVLLCFHCSICSTTDDWSDFKDGETCSQPDWGETVASLCVNSCVCSVSVRVHRPRRPAGLWGSETLHISETTRQTAAESDRTAEKQKTSLHSSDLSDGKSWSAALVTRGQMWTDVRGSNWVTYSLTTSELTFDLNLVFVLGLKQWSCWICP